MAVIDIRGLHIERDGVAPVDQIDWRVAPGEHWAIIGPNGAGKTSLLRALMGYLPGRGRVEVLGEEFGASDWRALRKRVGLVTSALAAMIPPNEVAWRTVASGREAHIGTWSEPTLIERDAAHARLDEVGAWAIAARPWQVLSQGERQRVLIARALMADPGVLIFDEACAGLDLVARERQLELVTRLAAPGGPTLVVVTHHIEEIVPALTHTLVLAQGRVAAAGPTARVLSSAVLSAAFDVPIVVTAQRTPTGLRYGARLA